MSLDSLRDLRRSGSSPDVIVKVVVGRRIPALEASPDVITILPADQPALLDLRPIVGLPLALFVCPGSDELAESTLDALLAAGGRVHGAAWSDATCTTDEPTKPVLHRMWELLCL